MITIQTLTESVSPLRKQLIEHPVYAAVSELEHLQEFTRYHVFAVWDFMSLLKSLQLQLTCVTVPWMPVGSGNVRYLINEIVTGEESDEAPAIGNGPTRRLSHFELYHEAMHQMGADTSLIDQLFTNLNQGKSVELSLQTIDLPEGVRNFVEFTFEVIKTGKPHVIAAVFTFGREDLIPGMFIELVRRLDETHPQELAMFRFYLERHIELDGDHHSHLAMQMVAELCGDDASRWEEAREWTARALAMRIGLWDAVVEEIGAPV